MILKNSFIVVCRLLLQYSINNETLKTKTLEKNHHVRTGRRHYRNR
jgi:hypothetical protein